MEFSKERENSKSAPRKVNSEAPAHRSGPFCRALTSQYRQVTAFEPGSHAQRIALLVERLPEETDQARSEPAGRAGGQRGGNLATAAGLQRAKPFG